jgi:hypothetical protein
LYLTYFLASMSFYIHHALCLSPQQSYPMVDLETVRKPEKGFLSVMDPGPGRIDRNAARRMSKPVRLGMTLAMEMKAPGDRIDGLIFATASAGNAAAMHFLQQIEAYDEGLLTPGDFVQSSPHALAGQIASVLHMNCYTNTHVHGGTAFEHALIDAQLQLNENPGAELLVGAMDEFSDYNHRIHIKAGWYADADGKNPFRSDGTSAVGGEGCALFQVNDQREGAVAQVRSVLTFTSGDPAYVASRVTSWFMETGVDGDEAPVLLSGETDDQVTRPVYAAVADALPRHSAVYHYKHLCGEYPTAGAFALWLATLPGGPAAWPAHMLARKGDEHSRHILLHHAYKGMHQSLVLLERMNETAGH